MLTGFMATGKSTVGRQLAARLRYGFVDTDRLIEERFGPVPKIFRTQGEERFRAIERELASELAALPALVIATGGGMLVDSAVADVFIGAGSLVVSLVADVDTIYQRPVENGPENDGRCLRLPIPDSASQNLLQNENRRTQGFLRCGPTPTHRHGLLMRSLR